jgi:hypothetical protein
MSEKNPREEEIIYAVHQLDPKRQLRVFSSPFRGKVKVHVREYYRRDLDSEYLVGRGMTFPPSALEEATKGMFLAAEVLKGIED